MFIYPIFEAGLSFNNVKKFIKKQISPTENMSEQELWNIVNTALSITYDNI